MRTRKSVNIPVEVLDDPRLSGNEVLLLAQILRFQSRIEKFNVNGLCELLYLSKNTIRNGLVKLTEGGYLKALPDHGGWILDGSKFDLQEDQNLGEKRSKIDPPKIKICVSEREKESTKEKDKENLNIEYIYNNNYKRVTDNEREREKRERESPAEPETENKPKPKRTVFVKPTRDEILAYCRERHSTVSSSAFFDFYESKGWMVGKNHMKDWKAAVRTWEQKDKHDGRFYVPPENRTDGGDDLPY